MGIRQFVREVTMREGKKKSLPVAQVSEVIRIVNDMTGGTFYAAIKGLPVDYDFPKGPAPTLPPKPPIMAEILKTTGEHQCAAKPNK